MWTAAPWPAPECEPCSTRRMSAWLEKRSAWRRRCSECGVGIPARFCLGTGKGYVQKVNKKLEVSDRTQAAVKAARLRLV